MSERSPTTEPTPDVLVGSALALLLDLARIAVDLDDPRSQRVVDQALRAACDRAQSWL